MTISDLKKISPEADAYEFKPGVAYLVCINVRTMSWTALGQLTEIFKKQNINAVVVTYVRDIDNVILTEAVVEKEDK